VEALDSFFDAASKLPVGTLMRLAAAHQAQDADTLKEARVRAMDLAERLGRQSDTDRLVGAISQWAAASAPTRGQYTYAGPTRDTFLADARLRAMPALIDAGLAALLAEDLDPETLATLRSAWRGSAT
jgi:hypothetical protein